MYIFPGTNLVQIANYDSHLSAPYKSGSHPNAVVAPRSHATYSRPIMATVYPQPQNHPGVPRASPPSQSSPSRFPYNPQTPNGVMIRPPGQQNVQYVVNAERKDNPTGQPLGVRQKSPSVQGPPPSYSAANSRPQHQQQQQASTDFRKFLESICINIPAIISVLFIILPVNSINSGTTTPG